MVPGVAGIPDHQAGSICPGPPAAPRLAPAVCLCRGKWLSPHLGRERSGNEEMQPGSPLGAASLQHWLCQAPLLHSERLIPQPSVRWSAGRRGEGGKRGCGARKAPALVSGLTASNPAGVQLPSDLWTYNRRELPPACVQRRHGAQGAPG